MFLSVLISLSATASALSPGTAAGTPFARLDARVFRLAQDAASCAARTTRVGNHRLLTVIDYSRPSTSPRLWVLDLERERVLYEELVAHGRRSGDKLSTRFSNEPGSHQTSLGLFVTADTYVGRNGYSLRLRGLEPGVNDRALERAIVMHGAPYVAPTLEHTRGRLGRSWGCPALRPAVARELIDTIKEGSLVFAYYPDERWLKSSRFIGECGERDTSGGLIASPGVTASP
jgi:L,D-transpeptidase catalytic domain